MHDPRVGRFFAVDPMVHAYPWYSPYQFSGNTPIMSIELEGLEPEVENGVLVGYNIQAGDGPTQVTAQLNDPSVQKKYGYTLQKPVEWKEVVKQNEAYYKEKGDWGATDMMDVNNPVWNNLNSNVKEFITFTEPTETTQSTTSKPISYVLRDLTTPDAVSRGTSSLTGVAISDGGYATEGLAGPPRGGSGGSWADFGGLLGWWQSIASVGRKGTPASKGVPRTQRNPTQSAIVKATNAIKINSSPNINVPNKWKKVRMYNYDVTHEWEVIMFASERAQIKNHHSNVNGRFPVILFSTSEENLTVQDSLNVVDEDVCGGCNLDRRVDSVRTRKRK